MELKVSRDSIFEAIVQIDKNPDLIRGRHSSTYDLIYNDKKYPPILVLSVANTLKGGKELTLEDFGNNVETPFKILRDKGFEVVPKSKKMKPNIYDFIKVSDEQVTGKGTSDSAKLFARDNKGDKEGLSTEISFGVGRASAIPWIAFIGFKQTIKNGIYPVYLYYKTAGKLILAYGISETNKPQYSWALNNDAITIEEFFTSSFRKLPERYGNSYVFKVYDVKSLPDPKSLKEDLMAVIHEYKMLFNGDKAPSKLTDIPFSVLQLELDLNNSGLLYSRNIILRFTASLLTKPFVLLTGLSGSGKTKIAQSFVKWICEDESQYRLIPVGADWTNREPLLGYPNGLNSIEYISPDSGSLNLILEAAKTENSHKPYFLILDEMNLSHVERYFADFLSVMESSDTIKLYTGSKRHDLNKNVIPNEIYWPKNLFIIGTVNIDETTYMFSPKVLDRANTIEFRVDETNIKSFFDLPSKIDLSVLESKGASMAKSFLEISQNNNIEIDKAYTENFVRFFNELKKIGAEFGYRSAIEMLVLIKNLNIIANVTKEESIDIAVMQKLLPKLHGSRNKISKVLDALILLCLVEGQSFSIAKYDEVLHENILYPISYEKLVRMYRNAIDNGFTSYAEA